MSGKYRDKNGYRRVDGSLGAALKHPCVEVYATKSKRLKIHGILPPLREIVEKTCQKVAREFGLGNAELYVDMRIPPHTGLGSGTALRLCVAYAMGELHGIRKSAVELGKIVGRGGTSGIGVAAFETGGALIIDKGHTFGPNGQKQCFLPSSASQGVPPPEIERRIELPEDLYFLVAIPKTCGGDVMAKGVQGKEEVNIFQKYCPIPFEEEKILRKVIFETIIPAIQDHNIREFGRGLNDIQEVGFKKREIELQHPFIRHLMKYMNDNGASGAGMSSFGPATYAVVEQKEGARALKRKIEEDLFRRSRVEGSVFLSEPNNKGVFIEKIPSGLEEVIGALHA